VSAPAPARAWSAETKRWWRDFWASERGQRIPASLQPTVWRLFGWYHRRNLLERRVDRLFEPPRGKAQDRIFTDGSMGQPKVNPLIAELRSIEAQIETLERRVFGEEPTSPSGAIANDPAALLAAANARFRELAGSLDHEDPADPRLEVIRGGKSASA